MSRMARLNALFKRELSKIMLACEDPRIGLTSITEVESSRDLSTAKVFVSIFDDVKVKETIDTLNHAAGFVRSQLAQNVHIRRVPSFRFYHDDTLADARKIEKLLAQIGARGAHEPS